MTPEEKQLLLRDLCARLPYRVICQMEDELIISDSHFYDCNLSERYIELFRNHKDFYIKPYLRPMSSMTEEEFYEYNYIRFSKIKDRINYERVDVGKFHNVGIIPIKEYIDWLNAHHFDYRGLIEKGLALEAPKDMYN